MSLVNYTDKLKLVKTNINDKNEFIVTFTTDGALQKLFDYVFIEVTGNIAFYNAGKKIPYSLNHYVSSVKKILDDNINNIPSDYGLEFWKRGNGDLSILIKTNTKHPLENYSTESIFKLVRAYSSIDPKFTLKHVESNPDLKIFVFNSFTEKVEAYVFNGFNSCQVHQGINSTTLNNVEYKKKLHEIFLDEISESKKWSTRHSRTRTNGSSN